MLISSKYLQKIICRDVHCVGKDNSHETSKSFSPFYSGYTFGDHVCPSEDDRRASMETVLTFMSSDSSSYNPTERVDDVTLPSHKEEVGYNSGSEYPNSSIISTSNLDDEVFNMSLPWTVQHQALYSLPTTQECGSVGGPRRDYRRQPVAEYVSLVVPVQGCPVVISDDKRMTLMPISPVKYTGSCYTSKVNGNGNDHIYSWISDNYM